MFYGPNARIDKKATVPLGLTKGDERLYLNQIAREQRNGALHAFFVLPNDGGYPLAYAPEHDTRYFYHVDKRFHFLGGVLIKIGEGTSVINAPDAQKAVNTELKDWAEFADATPLPSASPK